MSQDNSGPLPVRATVSPKCCLEYHSLTLRAPKTRTRGHTACSACRSRRSKCDNLSELGCHRCLQLGTACSLAGREGETTSHSRFGPLGSGSPSISHAAVLRRLAEVEARVNALDTAGKHETVAIKTSYGDCTSQSYHKTVMDTPSNESSSSRPAALKAPYASWRRAWTLPERYGLLHRGFYGNEEEVLPDPIAQNVITSREADMAFHL